MCLARAGGMGTSVLCPLRPYPLRHRCWWVWAHGGDLYSNPLQRKNPAPSKNACSQLRFPKWHPVFTAQPRRLQTPFPSDCVAPHCSVPGGLLPPPGFPALASRLTGGGLAVIKSVSHFPRLIMSSDHFAICLTCEQLSWKYYLLRSVNML